MRGIIDGLVYCGASTTVVRIRAAASRRSASHTRKKEVKGLMVLYNAQVHLRANQIKGEHSELPKIARLVQRTLCSGREEVGDQSLCPHHQYCRCCIVYCDPAHGNLGFGSKLVDKDVALLK